jgi:hypothetical protein
MLLSLALAMRRQNRPFTDISSAAQGEGLDGRPPRDQLHAKGSMGASIMDAITLAVFIASIYPAGRIAERRGRSFKVWAWIAVFIGPLALPLVFLFPNLHRENVGHA